MQYIKGVENGPFSVGGDRMAKKYLYGVYDTKYKEQCVLIADNFPEIADYLNVKYHTLVVGMMRDSKVCKRYKIAKIDEVEECQKGQNGVNLVQKKDK